MNYRKILKYLLRGLAILLGIVILVFILLYLPPVQNFVKEKAVTYVGKNLGIKMSVEKLRIKFPLKLEVNNIYLENFNEDTLVYAQTIQADVAITSLLRSELDFNKVVLQKALFHYLDTISALDLRVDAGDINIRARRINLKKKYIDATSVNLTDANVLLKIGQSKNDTIAKDTVTSWEFDVGEVNLKNINYEMTGLPLGVLKAGIGEGNITRGDLNLNTQRINVNRLFLSEAYCDILTIESEPQPPTETVPSDTTGSWIITASRLELEDSRFLMRELADSVSGKIFPAIIDISSLNASFDNAYNKSSEVKATIQQLRLHEASGLNIQNLSGYFEMLLDRTLAQNLNLQTSRSNVNIDGQIASYISDFDLDTPLNIKVNGNLSGNDVLSLITIESNDIRDLLINNVLAVQVDARGTGNDININTLNLQSTGNFRVQANGHVLNLTDTENISGNIDLYAFIINGSMFDGFIPDSLKGRLNIPDNLTLSGVASLESDIADVDITLQVESGTLLIDGIYNMSNDGYNARVQASNFDVSNILVQDSIGVVNVDLSAEGIGLKPETATADVHIHVYSLEYASHDFDSIVVDAQLSNSQLTGTVSSNNSELDLDLSVEAQFGNNSYSGNLEGEIRKVDLVALNMAQDSLIISMGITASGTYNVDSTFNLTATIDSLVVNDGVNKRLGDINLYATSQDSSIVADINAKGLNIDFHSNEPVKSVINKFSSFGNVLSEQMNSFDFNIKELSDSLPEFHLSFEAKTNNLINSYLKDKDINFKNLDLDIDVNKEKSLEIDLDLDGLTYNTIKIDSLLLKTQQVDSALNYGIEIYANQNQFKDFSKFSIDGDFEHNRLVVHFQEENDSESDIINIQANIEFQDSIINISLDQTPLVLGYVNWSVNQDNYVRIIKGSIPSANLNLTSEDKRIHLSSQDGADNRPLALDIDIKNVDLGNISRSLSFIPDMTGTLSTDLKLSNQNNTTDIAGEVTVDDFYYNKNRLGTLDMTVKYESVQAAQKTLNLNLLVDKVQALEATGTIQTEGETNGLAVTISIPQLPLQMANAFFPEETVMMDGNLTGRLDLRGTMRNPQINGNLQFINARAEVIPVGTTFGIDSDPINIQNSLLSFGNFGLVAPNNQKLTLNGSVNISSFSNIIMDAAVAAQNFQVVSSEDEGDNFVFGRAYIDVAATVKGALSDLAITGNVRLIDNTDVSYVIRTGDIGNIDKSIGIVRFVTFADSTEIYTEEIQTSGQSLSLDLGVVINISNYAKLNVLLSENGQNRISVSGNGELNYTSNRAGDTRFVGRYSLTEGIVSYGLPVIGQKDFTIDEGNYIEWTGDIANPIVNIEAEETVNSSVAIDDNSSTLVNFTAIIKITESLNNPNITFDLKATGNGEIENQLAGMTEEERSTQALNLMIYGTYTGPGAVSSTNISNNALNSFVQRELNEWSRNNLKGVDLNFGINTYDQLGEGGESTRTDYSYQFSKRFLDNRVRVKIGGKLSTGDDPNDTSNVEDNLVDDISLEYVFGKNPNFFIRVFRHINYESVLEGEVTETGASVVYRRKFDRFKDIFRKKKKRLAKISNDNAVLQDEDNK